MGIFDILGGPRRQVGGGMSPITMAMLGLLAYRTLKGKGRLADMLGRSSPAGAAGTAGATGGLGGLLGAGAAGGVLSGGLQDLIAHFRQAGREKKVQSWVSAGTNDPIAPDELEKTLGEERVQWLIEQTGMPKEQLLAGLSEALPDAVNRLTPNGRVPTEAELTELDRNSPTSPSQAGRN